MPDSNSIAAVRQRIEKDRTVWMATTRPDGRPHVAPIWFVWFDDKVYVMTGGVKLDNVRQNGFAALNTEDGVDVAIVEGTAKVIDTSDSLFDSVAKVFMERYDWDIANSIAHNQLIEITPVKTLQWNAG